METHSYSYTRQHLSEILNDVIDHSEVFCIERKNGKQAIILSKSDYEALVETAYLLRSPENAKKLMQGIEQAKSGKGTEIEF